MKRFLLILSLVFAMPMFAGQAIAAEPVTEEAAAAQLADLEGQALVDAVMALIASVDSTDAQSIKAILAAAYAIAYDFETPLITQSALEFGISPGLLVAAAQQANKRTTTAKKASGPTPQKSADTPPASYSNANSYGTGGG